MGVITDVTAGALSLWCTAEMLDPDGRVVSRNPHLGERAHHAKLRYDRPVAWFSTVTRDLTRRHQALRLRDLEVPRLFVFFDVAHQRAG